MDPLPNDHRFPGHVHRASYAGDGCEVCVEQAIARAKEENRGSTTLPEEKKVVWGALEQEGWTVPVGLIFVDEVPACMRDEWFGDA